MGLRNYTITMMIWTLRCRITYMYISLVHLESIYHQIFFYSKIVLNCAITKELF